MKAPAVGGRKSKKKPDEVPAPDVPLSLSERAAAEPLEPSEPEDGDEDQEPDEGAEDAPDFDGGVGVGAGNPDLDRLDARDKKRARADEPLAGDDRYERDVDMRPTEYAAGRPTEGPLGGDNDDIDDLGRALGKFGTRGRFRVRRLFPEDMPPNEMAIGPWIPIPGEAPNRDQVYDAITRRYGGGRYEVRVGDMNEGEFHKSMLIVIDVAGDPIPQTAYGRVWYQQRFGVPAPIPSGGLVTPGSGPPVAAGMAGGSDGVMLALMQMLSSDKEREARARGEDKDREVSLATAVLSKQGSGISSLLPLAPIVLEMWKSSREEARQNQQRHEALMMKLLDRDNKPVDVMAMVQPILALTQKRAELEMNDYSKRSDLMFKQLIESMKAGGNEEDATFLGSVLSAIKDGGGDFLRAVGPAIAAAVSRGNLQQMVQTDPRMAQVRQRLAQPAQRAIAPTQAAQPRAAAPPAAPLPAPAVGSEPPPPPGAPEPPPLPPEAGGGQPDPQLPPPAPEVQAPRALPRPGQMAVEISNQALHQFLFYLRGFAETGPDPIDFWDTNFDGQTIQTLFGLCPVWFRKRVEGVDVKAPFSMVEIGAGGPDNVVELCHEFDAFLEGNAASREWLGEFLEAGPWNEPDDDED